MVFGFFTAGVRRRLIDSSSAKLQPRLTASLGLALLRIVAMVLFAAAALSFFYLFLDRSTAQRVLVATYLVATLFLTSNWFMYIWAVQHGHVVETALGYFINPMLNVVFGALFLGEKPRRLQWMAIAAAASGVVYLTVAHGRPPWIALFLATTFGTYGLLKKRASLGALEGLSLETGLVFAPALAYLVWQEWAGTGVFLHADGATSVLLALSGVATALPLLFFAAAARRLTLTTLGIVQYLAPTIQFLLGVFLYREPFDVTRLIGFCLIWVGVGLYAAEIVVFRRRTQLQN